MKHSDWIKKKLRDLDHPIRVVYFKFVNETGHSSVFVYKDQNRSMRKRLKGQGDQMVLLKVAQWLLKSPKITKAVFIRKWNTLLKNSTTIWTKQMYTRCIKSCPNSNISPKLVTLRGPHNGLPIKKVKKFYPKTFPLSFRQNQRLKNLFFNETNFSTNLFLPFRHQIWTFQPHSTHSVPLSLLFVYSLSLSLSLSIVHMLTRSLIHLSLCFVSISLCTHLSQNA